MKRESIIYAIKNLMHRRLRSFLSVLSILIGVMAIFALVSFGLGLQNYVNVIAEEAGADKLFVQARGVGAPGSDDTFALSQADVDFVGKINGVDEVVGLYFRVAEIKDDDESKFNFVIGIDTEHIEFVEESFLVDILKGRTLKKGDIGKAVMGYNYLLEEKIFSKPLRLGSKFTINGELFEVAGFYEELGNPSDDANLYITNEAMEFLFDDIKDSFSMVMLRSETGVDPQKLSPRIQEKLRKFKGQEEGKEDFFVQTFDDILRVFGNIVGVLNGILVLIALISLVVASVNIMNTMYTAVLERTNEIGVMKAVGAQNKDILAIFVLESGLLGMVGGIIGVFFGYLISSFGGAIASSSGFGFLKPIFPWYLILGCVLFAFFVGAISGLLPAYQASKLKPVDALRYE